MLTGLGAGLVFGIQDALTRQTLQILSSSGVGAMFTTWAPYALVGAGAIGIWLMQSAFNSGPLPLSLPAISAGEPLVGIFLGVLVFGDRIQITPGELALQAGGIVALIAGVILVGRAPALSQLRRLTPPSLPHITGGLPSLPSLPSLPGLTGLTGRHSAEADQADRDQADRDQADRDQAPHPGVEALPGGNGNGDGLTNSNGDGLTNSHANGDGRHAGDGRHLGDGRHAGDDLRDGHPPPDRAHARDNEPLDQPADHPNP
jgi:hypothetical protein